MFIRYSGWRSAVSCGRLAGVGLLALGLAGCAQFPSLDALSAFKPASGYQTQASFTGPQVAWPEEGWWKAYGDKQLDGLIDEALRDSPDMSAAAARVRRAEAAGQVAGAPLQPQVGANASATQQRQSYNYLTPEAMTPEGWKDYGRATLDFSWELDFWGKNRAGLAAARITSYNVCYTKLLRGPSLSIAGVPKVRTIPSTRTQKSGKSPQAVSRSGASRTTVPESNSYNFV